MTQVLLQEGISDLVTAITSSITGQFSWEDWGISKVVSMSVNLLSAGMAQGLEEARGVVQKTQKAAKTTMEQVKDVAKDVACQVATGVMTECATMLLN